MGRIFAFCLLACAGGAALQAQQDRGTWHVLIEPTFMHPPVSFPIPGAERTVLVPGYVPPGEDPVYFSKEDWAATGVTWDQFRAVAAKNATDRKVNGELIRNSKKVVEYASLSSDNPLTATMILAPRFPLKKFQDIFGPKLLVAVPNRFTVYVFPALASNYQDYAALVIHAYHESAFPVSLEIFELSTEGLRAIGTFEQ